MLVELDFWRRLALLSSIVRTTAPVLLATSGLQDRTGDDEGESVRTQLLFLFPHQEICLFGARTDTSVRGKRKKRKQKRELDFKNIATYRTELGLFLFAASALYFEMRWGESRAGEGEGCFGGDEK